MAWGVAYKAEDLKLGRLVALKFPATHLVSDPEVRKSLEREVKAAASLNHPNICTVFEIDEVDGRIFLAMDLIEGQSLDGRIEQGPLALRDALDIARQAADGLQETYSKGVVNHDVKPGNILVTPQGRVDSRSQIELPVGNTLYDTPDRVSQRTDRLFNAPVRFRRRVADHPDRRRGR